MINKQDIFDSYICFMCDKRFLNTESEYEITFCDRQTGITGIVSLCQTCYDNFQHLCIGYKFYRENSDEFDCFKDQYEKYLLIVDKFEKYQANRQQGAR